MNPTNSSRQIQIIPALFLLFASIVLLLLLLNGGQSGVTAAPEGAQSADSLWQDVDEALLRVAGERRIVPQAYRTVALNWDQLNSLLVNVPDSAAARTSEVILSLPLPDGGYGRFQLYETAVMHPDLAAKFPEIRTYAGLDLDDPTATARLDTTPHGFHAMILSANGRVFIDPLTTASTDLYQSYFASDFIPDLPADFAPDLVVEPEGTAEKPAEISAVTSSGGTLRTYRLAVAATGEYTVYHGGAVNDAMSAITTAVNRVNGIYEREVAVTMQLIANNNLIIYTNGATDPYTNSNGGTMLTENQANLNSVIGLANYDIGHVFSTGGGGVAWLGSVCNSTTVPPDGVTGTKARGVTGLTSPIGDPFYVDYVAHEMGHQFAANHTFNSVLGACGGATAMPAPPTNRAAPQPSWDTRVFVVSTICKTTAMIISMPSALMRLLPLPRQGMAITAMCPQPLATHRPPLRLGPATASR